MKPHVVILGGPNLAELGTREPELYGETTWGELEGLCRGWADALQCELTFLQTDSEGELVGWIAEWGRRADGLILNAAAYTHTSVAVRDAVGATGAPVVELHLTNPDSREPLRRRNLLAGVVDAGIRGFGVDGYRLALEGLVSRLRDAGRTD